ncbi:uncharacterized protein LOC101737572 [Bombyx mori]|uniref:Uncharacterized protein n=1 Tax=Bombyx mori TaxID=7091 RepID=A0A8R2AH50_BOMMO|nr:uncharacterized protein LOC101737572 [Bombyx mori]
MQTMSATLNTDAYTDVVELCALLQCLGFSVKSLESTEANVGEDAGARTIVINCQSSGLHVVLESPSVSCSCPSASEQNSGIWQVSGVTGGKHLDKEFGWSLLGSLPKSHRDRLTKELLDVIRYIKEYNETDDKRREKEAIANRSASMLELTTPEKSHFQIKSDTPTRCRSLDTLTKVRKDDQLPVPRTLQRSRLNSEPSTDDDKAEIRQPMAQRQSTYTLSSTPGSARRRNKTSSPLKGPQNDLLGSLLAAEQTAEDLRRQLANVIKEIVDDAKNDSSLSSLVLDVSKISVLKVAETSKAQFASSPNLSALLTQEDFAKSRLKRYDSASTSNLLPDKPGTSKDKTSRLRRISPNFFKTKKDPPAIKIDKVKGQEKSSKINSLFRAKVVAPVRTSRSNAEFSPNLSSASKKKFSHVKSTIPRPSKKE